MIPSAVELAASQYGLQLIGYDRPGYGDLAVWGHSGGGPFALACAALLPGLVVSASVFASVAPADAEGLDFFATWPPEEREEIELFYRQPERARELRWSHAQERLPALSTIGGWLDLFGIAAETAPPGTLELAEHLALVQQDTLCRGDQGWWDDNVAYLTPWGFDPANITVPVQLWHGENDQAVPPAHGHWFASHIEGLDAHFPADDDHGSIHDGHLDEAYTWISRVRFA
jgi:pimeloyl-ACP methyl ester carboxylesterase